jgi:hypothetical protein
MRMFPKDVPMILRDAITCFASANGSKFEWAVNVSIKMGDIEPFSKRQKIVTECKVVRRIGWANEVCLAGYCGMVNILASVKLDPITLVDRIITPVCWVTYVEFEQEPTIQRARRIYRDGVAEGNPCKSPFVNIIGTDVVRYEEQSICAFDDGGGE